MKNRLPIVVHLLLIKGIGPATIAKLVAMCDERGVSLDELYQFRSGDFMQVGLSCEQAGILVAGLGDKRSRDDELALIERYGYKLLTADDAEYPPLLRMIHLPPPVLYVQGHCEALTERALAIVGSRQANAYGYAAVDHFVPHLVAQGWTVVSGGARGIDMYAHKAALAAGGKTVAIIGSGLLKPYPREHMALFKRIADEGGAVVSTFPLKMEALAGHFPARNRIIAGMARATLVIQASQKSGARITASYALHEGREVGAVPGSIFDPLSEGCHALIAEGATPVTDMASLGALLGDVPERTVRDTQLELTQHEGTPERGFVVKAASVVPRDPVLLAWCREPKSYDELLVKTGLAPEGLYDLLWELQEQGALEQTGSGLWRSRLS